MSSFRSPIACYRLSRWLAEKHVPAIPRLIDYISRFVYSCWLPHTARVGKNLGLGYGGLGVVIHSNAVIGDNVHIGQCVTLGGNGREYGQPEICDNVYIGCGAKILGPVKVGQGSIIGANSVVLKNVPERCVVAGIPARVIHEDIDIGHYLWHLRNFPTEGNLR